MITIDHVKQAKAYPAASSGTCLRLRIVCMRHFIGLLGHYVEPNLPYAFHPRSELRGIDIK